MSDGPKWTQQQRMAIETLDRDVLVTASAGTGKTAVLSQRCVDILANEQDPTAVDRLLVLTFTEASAEEMLERIGAELRKRYKQQRSSHLKRQMLMLDAAYISTIDSFCKRLVSEHFHQLGIDPTFRIIDADEQKLLKSELLDETVEQAWKDETLVAAIHQLLGGRNVQSSGRSFLRNIVSASEFLDSVASRESWFERARLLAGTAKLADSDLADEQRELLLESLKELREKLEHAIGIDAAICGGHWGDWIAAEYVSVVDECIASCLNGDDKFVKLLYAFKAPTFKRAGKEIAKADKEIVKSIVDEVKADLKKLCELAIVNADYEQIIAPETAGQTQLMLRLVEMFDANYARAKREVNCLDFADLEHLALRLLRNSERIRDYYRGKFRFIFIDEYQDTNTLQNAILDELASGDNTFVVGDIKQSIYAFRQARPELFIERLARGSDRPADGGALRVDLSDNFRSRAGVLDFANTVFERVMSEGMAGAAYDDRAMLRAGFPYEDISAANTNGADGHVVELKLVDETESDDADETDAAVSKIERQGALIAHRIRQMVGAADNGAEFTIFDRHEGMNRDVEFRDIVILMRSPGARGGELTDILRLAGVPVISDSSRGYFDTTEITDAVSLLKVLDNPQRDIELAAVMRSPVFGMSDGELARIRIAMRNNGNAREAGFYEAVMNYADSGDDASLVNKVIGVLARLREWRSQARRGSLADLLWQIYRDTGYLSHVCAQSNGSQRRSNLLKLHDRAIEFEGFASNAGGTSLTRFVEFIEKLLDEEGDWAPAQSEEAGENAVRIMSVHKSKGLEYPVVFLAELEKQFNMQDLRNDCVLDEHSTLGLAVIDSESGEKFDSIARQVICAKAKRTLLAEELRILYVAMTRARERLVLVGSKKADKVRPIVQSCALMDTGRVADWLLRKAASHLDWILYGIGNHAKLANLFGVESSNALMDGELFAADVFDRDELSMEVGQLREFSRGGERIDPVSAGAEMMAEVKAAVGWRYPWEGLTDLPAKSSVSQLTHRDDEFAKLDISGALNRLPRAVAKTQKPSGGRADRKLLGSATHLVFETLDLNSPVDGTAVRTSIERLTAEGMIPGSIANAIDVDSVVDFFQTGPGKLVFESESVVRREWPFTYGVDAGSIDPAGAGETIVVQGIVDMIVERPEGLVIIDFKTDNVHGEAVARRAAGYAEQVRHYAAAAGAILDKPVEGAYLYFAGPREMVDIDL